MTYTNAISQPSALDNYFSQIRLGQHISPPAEILNDTQHAKQILRELQNYAGDTLPNIRSKSYDLAGCIGQKSKNQKIRQQAVHLLVNGIGDKDSGTSGSNSKALQDFKKEDFPDEDKHILVSYLVPQTHYLDQVAMLTGYLEIKEAIVPLKQLLTAKINYKVKWHIALALARMNDQQGVDYIMGLVKRGKVDDNMVYSIVPGLVYTRNKQIFKFLEEIIMSDEKSCQSPDPNANQNILCSYRVMEYLAGRIEEFPIQVDEFGEAEIDNYEKTLDEVRQWFVSNEGYLITRDTY